MFTAHGHQIPGTVAEERPPGMKVARCGGVANCGQCKTEAAYHTTPQTGVEWDIDANRPVAESQSFEEQTPLPAGPVRFRKLPVEFEAIQWTGNNLAEMQRFCGTRVVLDEDYPNFYQDVYGVGTLWVAANNKSLKIERTEWVIKDEKGFYPCKDDIIRANNIELTDETIELLREMDEPKSFDQELVSLLNKHSMENRSGTPDWILGEFVMASLRAWNLGTRLRSEWRGEDLELPALQMLDKDHKTIVKLEALLKDGVIKLNPEFRNTKLYSELKESAPDQDVVARMDGKEVPLVVYTDGQRNEVGTATVSVTPGEVHVTGTITGAVPMFEDSGASYSIGSSQEVNDPEELRRERKIDPEPGQIRDAFQRYQQKGLNDG